MSDWFSSWFDTEYYHALYAHRDTNEAAFFIENIVDQLAFHPPKKILEIACGKGRHAKHFNRLGFNVLGVDLSRKSIKEAQKMQTNTLQFQVQDMRNLEYKQSFDLATCLFTSFGYFDSSLDDQKIVHGAYNALKPGGFFVLDFLNAHLVENALRDKPLQTGVIKRGTYRFETKKYIASSFVKKSIKVFDNEEFKAEFHEQVRLYSAKELRALIEAQGFKIRAVYGNYTLEKFDQEKSPRCVIFAVK